MTDELAAAREYVRRGWVVIPLRRGTPFPADAGWPDQPMPTDEQLVAWFGGPEPLNVGILTGERSGVVVLDVDPRNGGLESYAKLATEVDLPETWADTTPGHGTHELYAYRLPLRSGKLPELPGIDVLADGRQCAMPPSVREDGAYVRALHEEPAELPETIVKMRSSFEPRAVEVVPDRDPEHWGSSHGCAYAVAALHREANTVRFARSNRNEALNHAAYRAWQLVAGGCLDEAYAEEELRRAADACGLFEPDEAEKTERLLARVPAEASKSPRTCPEPEAVVVEEEEPADGIRFLELGAEIPETAYLDEPIVPAGAFVFFVGAEASSKTVVARWLALKVAAAGRRVLYFSEDNPEVKDRQHLARLLAGLKLDPTRLPDTLRYAHSQGVDLSEPYWRAKVLEIVRRDRPELIVFDGYATMFGGGMAAKEYESWDTASVFATLLKEIRALCGSAVITICHGPNSAPKRLPGGSALRLVADLRVEFEGTYAGGAVSTFEFENGKATRYPGFRFEGRVLGPPDDRSPLTVTLRRLDLWQASASSARPDTSSEPSSRSGPPRPLPAPARAGGPGSTTTTDPRPRPSAWPPTAPRSASRRTGNRGGAARHL